MLPRPNLRTMTMAAGAFIMFTAQAAAAHGTDINADLGDEVIRLELTDETGEVCIEVDSSVELEPATDPNMSQATVWVAIAHGDTNDIVLDLGGELGPDQQCQTLDVDTVNAVLANVGGYELIRERADGTIDRAPLAKPQLQASETAIADEPAEDTGLNVPLIFAVGACFGVALVILRKRFGSR